MIRAVNRVSECLLFKSIFGAWYCVLLSMRCVKHGECETEYYRQDE